MKNIAHQVEFSVFSLGTKSYLVLCSVHCQTQFGCCTALSIGPETLGLCSSLWKGRDESTDASVCPRQTLTPSLPLSVCPAFSSLSLFRCPAQTFQTSLALFHPVHISLSYVIASFINPSTQSMFPLDVSAGFAPPGFSHPAFLVTKIGWLLLFHEASGEEPLLLQHFCIPDFSISSLMGNPVHPRTGRSSVMQE